MNEQELCANCGGLMIPEEIGADGRPPSTRRVCSQCGGRVSTTDKPHGPAKVFLAELSISAFGALMVYVFGYRPYASIQRGEELQLSLWGLLVGGVILGFGLGLTLTTLSCAIQRTKTAGKWGQRAFVAVVILCSLAGFFGYFWLRQLAKDRGYAL
jgi:hypothetical protein